jgi:hypothetical protein
MDTGRMLLQRARTILDNMAKENPWRKPGQFWKPRWSISDEPLRADAKALLHEIDAFYEREGALRKGAKARLEGKPITANPYRDVPSALLRPWLDGWTTTDQAVTDLTGDTPQT